MNKPPIRPRLAPFREWDGAVSITHEWHPGSTARAEPTGPFTADWLRKEIQSLRRRCCSPPDHELAQLATLFNTIAGLYRAKDVAGANQAHAAEVHCALWVLMRFFAMRRQACEAPGVDPRIVESELRLCEQFDKLKEAMQAHAWALGIDAGLHMWPYESFRDFAHWIALAFRLALEESNAGKIRPAHCSAYGQGVRGDHRREAKGVDRRTALAAAVPEETLSDAPHWGVKNASRFLLVKTFARLFISRP